MSAKLAEFFSFFRARQKLSAFLLYLGAVCLVYAPVVFLGRSLQAPLFYEKTVTAAGVFGAQGRQPVNSFNVDLTNGVYANFPLNKLIGDIYKSGQIPLWNPYQAAGEPLPEQYGTKVFFPYQILESLAPSSTWDFFVLGRLVLAGFFTWLFLRSLRLSFWNAFLGGLVFMLSGSFTIFIQNEQMANVAMMIPLMLWTAERLFGCPSGVNIALSAVVVALTLSAGTPGVILYALFLTSAYFLFRLLTQEPEGLLAKSPFQDKIKRLGLALLAFILGLGLAAPLLLPFLEFLGNVTFNFRMNHGLLTVPWFLIGFSLSPLLAEIPTFFRFQPLNGLWDYLGGYLGALGTLFVAAGFLANLIFREKHTQAYRRVFYFFSAGALLIFLKNLGLPPFSWLGYLPFFKTVWSPRWAGPIWVFCLAVAGALALELLKEQGPKIMEKLRSAKRLKRWLVFFSLLTAGVWLTLPLVAYYQGPVFLKDANNLIGPVVYGELENFVFSWLATFLTLAMGAYFIGRYIKNKDQSALFALVGLALLELWFWIPFGYGLDSLRLKFGLFIFGLAAIIVVAWKKKLAWLVSAFALFFFGFLFLDLVALQGLPQRQEAFREPPAVSFIKDQPGFWRVMGDTTALMPNWASAFGLMDVRYVNESGTINWYRYFRRYKLDDTLLDWATISPWFTGRRFSVPEASDANDLEAKKNLCPEMPLAEFADLRNHDMVADKVRSLLPFYSLLGVRYILTAESNVNAGLEASDPLYFPLVYQGEINVYENRSALDRVFIVHNARYAPTYQAAQDILEEENLDLRQTVILEKELPAGSSLGQTDEEAAVISDYRPNKVTIKAAASTPGILVLTDVYYPGWQAEIDGRPVEVFRVDGLVRGVYLPAGEHEVVFSYRPSGFILGGWGFLFSFLACLLLLSFCGRQPAVNKKRCLAVALLIAAAILYIYLANYLDNFLAFTSFKTVEEQRIEQADAEQKTRAFLYQERLAVTEGISKNSEFLKGFPFSNNGNLVFDQFSFAEDSSREFYVQLDNGGQEGRILFYVRDKEKIKGPEDFFSKEELDKIRRGDPSMLSQIAAQLAAQKTGTPQNQVFIAVAYLEELGGRWILKAGQDLLADKKLVNYRFNCPRYVWVEQKALK